MQTSYNFPLHHFNVTTIRCNALLRDLDFCDVYERLHLDDDTEIMQCYITNCDDWTADRLTNLFPDVLLYYYAELDLYLLLVDHYGCSWDYVPTRVDEAYMLPDTWEAKEIMKASADFECRR